VKAIIFRRYGSPDRIRLEDVEPPVAGDAQVLVRVRAASINPLDWHRLRGQPYPMRGSEGLTKPKNTGLGADLAGVVEAVGSGVTRFELGDEVFGMSTRTCAELVRVAEEGLVHKPGNITFEQAAAVPVAALTALQGLRDKGRIQQGHSVLVNGAAGGVGTFAVQIAKAFGATVTGVCSSRNVELVRSLGADRVIDYTERDFTAGEERYDLVFEGVGSPSLAKCRGVLKPEGRLVVVGAGSGQWVGPLLRPVGGLLLSWFGSRKLLPFLTKRNHDDLLTMKELIEAGRVTPVIDRAYPLSELAEAMRYLEAGHAQGKVVITV